jgi:hypothetical protein
VKNIDSSRMVFGGVCVTIIIYVIFLAIQEYSSSLQSLSLQSLLDKLIIILYDPPSYERENLIEPKIPLIVIGIGIALHLIYFEVLYRHKDSEIKYHITHSIVFSLGLSLLPCIIIYIMDPYGGVIVLFMIFPLVFIFIGLAGLPVAVLYKLRKLLPLKRRKDNLDIKWVCLRRARIL